MKLSFLSLAIVTLLPSLSYAEISTKITTKQQIQNGSVSQLKVLYQQDFTQQKSIPQGWRIPGNNAGNVYVEKGILNIDGRANAMQTTSILLPQNLEKQQNYRIDLELSLDQPLNNSRWGSVIYDVTEAQGVIPSRYYQFTLRADTTAKNGTEFGRRKANGQWELFETKAFSENIKPNQWYKASIVVSGQRVQHYLNGQLMQDVELEQLSAKGGIGLSAAGVILKVKNIQVSEQVTALPNLQNKVIQVQEIESNVALAPTIIQKIENSSSPLNSANQLYYQLDAQLNLFNQNGQNIGTLAQYLAQPQRNTIPVLEIKEPKTLEALKLLANTQDISDITLLSKSDDLLKTAHQIVPMVRTALDLSAEKLKDNRQSLSEIIRRSNQAYARIVVLPQSLANKSSVSFIQRHLMTVWMDSSVTQPQQAAQILTSGVNGIITTQSTLFSSVLKQFPKNTLLRKPFIIGHRGVPSLEDENTLESAKHAVALGADIVENDIYLTKDQQLVVMHDATVDRTTTSTGKIEEMTLAQVQQLKSKNKEYKIPTLAEYFSSFKNNPNFVLMIEMKSADPQLVPKMQEEIKKYRVENQVVTTSFNIDQVARAQTLLPHIPRGLLVGMMPKNYNNLVSAKQINVDVQKYNSSYNPAYRADLITLLEITKHRGISFWPWALNDETFKKLYIAGTYGITTNSAQLYSQYIVDVQVPQNMKAQVNQPVQLIAQLTQQDQTQSRQEIRDFLVLSGSPKYEFKNGQLSFSEKGTAYVLAGYKYQIDSQNFYQIFSAPMKIVVK
ncbi:glycerophosphodiester phosphodiesterase family protein [Acinetobacter piscicola]|uniref:glycerophosphodiester phosphodiesterase family protein n=1 Tax=Acinetobacter piscicola TaxID=2006115 RepID=UPI000B7F9484|nr:glycerophosphodiester phosphodiesterase family protein [Acinetobacter piscicola]